MAKRSSEDESRISSRSRLTKGASADRTVLISEAHNLVVKDNKYYIVDTSTQEELSLGHVTNAYVLYIKDEDHDRHLNGLFIQKDGNRYFINENAEVLADMTGAAIKEDSRFIIKEDMIRVVE